MLWIRLGCTTNHHVPFAFARLELCLHSYFSSLFSFGSDRETSYSNDRAGAQARRVTASLYPGLPLRLQQLQFRQHRQRLAHKLVFIVNVGTLIGVGAKREDRLAVVMIVMLFALDHDAAQARKSCRGQKRIQRRPVELLVRGPT
ncbi:hypothetical protein B0H12DRAFT_1116454 [Mycena haematopus]|nr:hypothetical protein B0H12DRAFT_1116454 [Mycena haematopus]